MWTQVWTHWNSKSCWLCVCMTGTNTLETFLIEYAEIEHMPKLWPNGKIPRSVVHRNICTCLPSSQCRPDHVYLQFWTDEAQRWQRALRAYAIPPSLEVSETTRGAEHSAGESGKPTRAGVAKTSCSHFSHILAMIKYHSFALSNFAPNHLTRMWWRKVH